ncbi:pyridoxamine 5'-phosphate oxidase family protein [Nocardiopsis halotolerans]|uniref:pyridoxamine 5'-phosphate oxidase family protein n=1 Tax=Nocardiopsis halotolerans TaxID=124252 RepID=UPI000346496A|nr:pyridoxamine 5'-phosphate oxidase family protein [Nocardiopsis halotolerans]
MSDAPSTSGQPEHPFDVHAFLARPLVARVATSDSSGAPTVRPVWFLWEEGAMWWLTGSYSRLSRLLAKDPRVALTVDTCDLDRLEFLQVIMRGKAEVAPFDQARAKRKLRRYLGEDESTWPVYFTHFEDDTRFVRFVPERTIVQDLSKTRP